LNSKTGSSQSYKRIGWFYHNLENYEEAVKAFLKAVELAPNNADLRTELGYNLLVQGKYEEAIIEFEKAIEINPGFYPAHFRLARAQFLNGQYDDALIRYQKAIPLLKHRDRNDKGALHKGVGDIYYIQGDYEEAIQYYRKNLEYRRNPVYGSLALYIALKKAGYHQNAKKLLKDFIDRNIADSWGPNLIRFYAGEIGEETLLKSTGHYNPYTELKRKCEAFYYIGVYLVLTIDSENTSHHKDMLKAKNYFERCIDIGIHYYVEPVLAKKELRHFKKRL